MTDGHPDALVARGLSKVFGRDRNSRVDALIDVSLSVARNEIVGVVGESGSGKTTLGRIIVGSTAPSAGTVEFPGATPRRVHRQLVSPAQMVFQDFSASLNPRYSVRTALRRVLRLHGCPRADLGAEIDRLLSAVGLPSDVLSRRPHQLSGGQQQRVAIARALAARPEVLVADEPTSALDVSVQLQIISLLREISTAMNLAIVFISHNLGTVRYLCDRTVVMYAGRVVDEGPTEGVFSAPAHPYTRALLDAVPSLNAKSTGTIDVAAEPAMDTAATGCRYRPRCPLVVPGRCDVEEPALLPLGDDRQARCFLLEDRDVRARHEVVDVHE